MDGILLISFSLGLEWVHVVFLRSASVLYVTRRLTIGRRWSCVMRVTHNTDALRKNTTWTHSRPREKEMNSGIKSLFLFTFCAQKVFSSLDKLKIEPLMSHGLFWWCLYCLSGRGQYAVHWLSMEEQKALGLNLKYLKLCSEDERRSYRLGTTRVWVINDIIFIFGWTNPLNWSKVTVKTFTV